MLQAQQLFAKAQFTLAVMTATFRRKKLIFALASNHESMPTEANQAAGIDSGPCKDECAVTSKDGAIVPYKTPFQSQSGIKRCLLFLLKRVVPVLLPAGLGYTLCYASLQGTIKSLTTEVQALRELKKRVEQDPASKEYACGQYAAILAKDNEYVYRDLKKSCMSSPK